MTDHAEEYRQSLKDTGVVPSDPLGLEYHSPVPDEERSVPSEEIAALRGIVAEFQRDTRIPPWRTPEGRKWRARRKARKAAGQARKRARRS